MMFAKHSVGRFRADWLALVCDQDRDGMHTVSNTRHRHGQLVLGYFNHRLSIEKKLNFCSWICSEIEKEREGEGVCCAGRIERVDEGKERIMKS